MKTLRSTIKLLCTMYGIKPHTKLGQNFLCDEAILKKIVATAEIAKDDVILEVGPGLGIMTTLLAQQAKKVIAVEIDKKFVEVLKARLYGYENVEIIEGDILRLTEDSFFWRGVCGGFDWVQKSGELSWLDSSHGSDTSDESDRLGKPRYKIVANIPYNITSHFLRKFLTLPFFPHPPLPRLPPSRTLRGTSRRASSNPLLLGDDPSALARAEWLEVEWPPGMKEGFCRPKMMVLLVQKEVAERICKKPGAMSLLSFSVQFYAEPKIIEYVGKENFWPEPKVDSAIIKIVPRPQNQIQQALQKFEVDEKFLFLLVKFGFSSRRKQLKNNLASGLSSYFKHEVSKVKIQEVLTKVGISPQARAQELSVDNWLNLAKGVLSFLGD